VGRIAAYLGSRIASQHPGRPGRLNATTRRIRDDVGRRGCGSRCQEKSGHWAADSPRQTQSFLSLGGGGCAFPCARRCAPPPQASQLQRHALATCNVPNHASGDLRFPAGSGAAIGSTGKPWGTRRSSSQPPIAMPTRANDNSIVPSSRSSPRRARHEAQPDRSTRISWRPK
jgi:hypothetical protein